MNGERTPSGPTNGIGWLLMIWLFKVLALTLAYLWIRANQSFPHFWAALAICMAMCAVAIEIFMTWWERRHPGDPKK